MFVIVTNMVFVMLRGKYCSNIMSTKTIRLLHVFMYVATSWPADHQYKHNHHAVIRGHNFHFTLLVLILMMLGKSMRPCNVE